MIAAWKELFSRKLNESTNACSVNVDEIVQSSHNPQYICRKCFSSYERFQHQQEELVQKVEIAFLYFKLRNGFLQPDWVAISAMYMWVGKYISLTGKVYRRNLPNKQPFSGITSCAMVTSATYWLKMATKCL